MSFTSLLSNKVTPFLTAVSAIAIQTSQGETMAAVLANKATDISLAK